VSVLLTQLKTIYQQYFSFSGRIGRKDFCIRVISGYLVTFVGIFSLFEPINPRIGINYSSYIPLAFILWFGLWFLYANINRRFHDIGKGSTWTAIMFFSSKITVVFVLFNLYLFFIKGSPSANKYGEAPSANDV
jgi:Predicted membrane protein